MALLLILLNIWRGIYTDWLWFQETGYQDVFLKILSTRLWLFAAGAITFGVFLGVNLALAYRLTRGESLIPMTAEVAMWLRRLTIAGAVLATLLLSLIFGSIAGGRWETVLRFTNSVSFGVADPQFSRDVSFYVFTMPILAMVQGWLLGALVVSLLATGGMYYVRISLRGMTFALTPRLRAHLSVLGALLLLDLAFSHYLSVFQLVYSTDGVVFGASYADVHAKIPALRLLIAIAAASAVLLVASNFFTRALWLMGGAVGLWIGAAVIVGGIFPALVQRYQVLPSELSRETPYLQRNIDATRQAFGLDRIETEPFPVEGTLDLQTVQAQRGTIDNIRLWDHRPLKDSYNQVQFFRPYYEFLDVDVDRYALGSTIRRQVMLAPRELSPQRLDPNAQTWVNQRLKYTHGYGIAISPVEKFTAEGRPEFFLKDVPPVPQSGYEEFLSLERPEIYYGESSASFVIVNTKEQEFDYEPLEGPAIYTQYQGRGGVLIGSFIRRAAYAWQFADVNILLSGELTPESRIQYRRTIQERVSAVAPFLLLDHDPYVVVADGAIWWIQDAYTVTDLYPYSDPQDKGFNYIRNSVKVVINAYDGTLDFYIFDDQDPLVRSYDKMFPGLFQPRESMPESLLEHVRYPEDLFTWQALTYLLYHMVDPPVFYNAGDQWSAPHEVFFESNVPMEPYYVTMRLTEGEPEEFALILPFTPFERKNMVAWLAAGSDGDNYGKLKAFTFPRARQIDGPEQIEARINNDASIAEQFGLWRRAQTNVLRGNLLVIPIGKTLLYAEPVYLQAQNLEFPELKMVILADAAQVTMQPSLNKAIAALLGEAPPDVSVTPSTGVTAEAISRLRARLEEMSATFEGLQEEFTALQQALDELEALLEETSP